jgi:outer membrane protein
MLVAALLWVLAAETAPPARVLTLDQALHLAREHQPDVRQARARSEAANQRALEARAALLPDVEGVASFERTTANIASRPGVVPSQFLINTANRWTTFNYFNFGVTASELIFDFGRTSGQWRASQASAQAEAQNANTTWAQTVLNVQNAFFSAQARRALLGVARQTVANQNEHLRQVQGFVDVGARPAIDLAQARADRANAELQLVNADNAYEVAKAQLNQAVGVEQDTHYDVADAPAEPVPGEDSPVQALFDEALANRPEVAAQIQQVRAQELAVRALQGSYFPSLGASTALTDAGEHLGKMAWNWNVSLTLTWGLFRGGGDRARVREAEANVRAAQAQMDSLRLSVRVQVEQALLGVRAARIGITAAQDVLDNARVRLNLAEGRYQTGIGSIIELSDAQVALTNAAAQRVQADYSLAAARASLQRARGVPPSR